MQSAASVVQSIEAAAELSKAWFLDTSSPRTRSDFMAKGKLGDTGKGAVYAYFGADDEPLYVGESGRAIKRRLHDQTSPHKKAVWWKSWKTVRFVQLTNRTDRLTLELLLILALNPKYNSKPGGRALSSMFIDET